MGKFGDISRVVAVVLAAGVFVFACKKEEVADTSAPATKEDVVRIFNWTDYIGETTLADFTAATGIKATYDTYDSNDTLDAKLKIGSTGYDIVVPTAQPFFSRQVKDGVFRKLDKSKIPNIKNLDPALMKLVEVADPGNEHGVIYQWGTNGLGYNVKMIKDRMADAPVDSWDLLFKPDVVKKFADCGVMVLDSATEVMPIALAYLGKDPNSHSPDDLKAAEALMMSIRPYIKKFESSEYINALANGDICLALGFSGDMVQAKARANEAQNGQKISYIIPKEGTMIWFDMMGVLADAPHPEAAFAFINFVLDPKVMAGITNFVAYPNAVPASLPDVKDEIKNDPNIYPPADVTEKLFVVEAAPDEYDRLRTDAWSRIRAGR